MAPWYDDITEQDEVDGVVTICPHCGRHYLPAPCPEPDTTPCEHGEPDWRGCAVCVRDEYETRQWERSQDR